MTSVLAELWGLEHKINQLINDIKAFSEEVAKSKVLTHLCEYHKEENEFACEEKIYSYKKIGEREKEINDTFKELSEILEDIGEIIDSEKVCLKLNEKVIHRMKKLIDKTINENVEYGFIICEDGSFSQVCKGDSCSVSLVPAAVQCEGKYFIRFHTHPKSLYADRFSNADIENAYNTETPILCIGYTDEFNNKKIRCGDSKRLYRLKEEFKGEIPGREMETNSCVMEY